MAPEGVQAQVNELRDGNEHPVSEISAALERLGGQALDLHVDAMGHIADWVTAFRSMGGEQGALHAMHTAEKYHNTRYDEAVTWDVGDIDLQATLQRFYVEEMRHLEFVETKLGVQAEASK